MASSTKAATSALASFGRNTRSSTAALVALLGPAPTRVRTSSRPAWPRSHPSLRRMARPFAADRRLDTFHLRAARNPEVSATSRMVATDFGPAGSAARQTRSFCVRVREEEASASLSCVALSKLRGDFGACSCGESEYVLCALNELA